MCSNTLHLRLGKFKQVNRNRARVEGGRVRSVPHALRARAGAAAAGAGANSASGNVTFVTFNFFALLPVPTCRCGGEAAVFATAAGGDAGTRGCISPGAQRVSGTRV
jgi:hypothetical protein